MQNHCWNVVWCGQPQIAPYFSIHKNIMAQLKIFKGNYLCNNKQDVSLPADFRKYKLCPLSVSKDNCFVTVTNTPIGYLAFGYHFFHGSKLDIIWSIPCFYNSMILFLLSYSKSTARRSGFYRQLVWASSPKPEVWKVWKVSAALR